MTFQPSLDSASRLLHDYAELQRASDRLLMTALEIGANPTDIRELVRVQREMLGGALTLGVGQVDLLKVFSRDERLAAAAISALSANSPRPSYDPDDPDLRDHGHDEMGMPS